MDPIESAPDRISTRMWATGRQLQSTAAVRLPMEKDRGRDSYGTGREPESAMSWDSGLPRRVIFKAAGSWAAASLAAGWWDPRAGGLFAGESPPATAPGEPVLLAVSPDHRLFRVRLEMDVRGNVHVPENALASRKKRKQVPITSRAAFDYEERLRLPEGIDDVSVVTAAERHYFQAESSSQLNRNESTLTLREGVRRVVVRRDMLPETIYSPDDYFTHQELQLLQIPTSSLAVDGLMPQTAIRTGEPFRVDREAMRMLLNLSVIDRHEVTGELVEADGNVAKIQLTGELAGWVDGVETEIRVVGKLTFDRRLGSTTWLAIAVHETREISRALPGFDVTATIKMLRKPADSPAGLPAEPPEIAISEPVPADRTLVSLTSQELGFSALMDRRWRMMRDAPGSAMMRMIEHDRSIAQCDIRPLAVLPEGRVWSLEGLQRDARRTIGNRLTEIVDADEGVTETGLRGLQVTAHGQVDGIPIRWVLIHLADGQGRRMLATFTIESDRLDDFAGSDVQFANSFAFADTPPPQRPPAPPETAGADESQAKLDPADGGPRR